MIKSGFYIEIIVEGSRASLNEDIISTVLKSWQRDLKIQTFENEGLKIKICEISETELKDNGKQLMREESIYRQMSDPLLTTFEKSDG